MINFISLQSTTAANHHHVQFLISINHLVVTLAALWNNIKRIGVTSGHLEFVPIVAVRLLSNKTHVSFDLVVVVYGLSSHIIFYFESFFLQFPSSKSMFQDGNGWTLYSGIQLRDVQMDT